MKKLKHVLTIINAEWIKKYPDVAYELLDGLITEYYAMKDVIEVQNEKLLILSAMLEK